MVQIRLFFAKIAGPGINYPEALRLCKEAGGVILPHSLSFSFDPHHTRSLTATRKRKPATNMRK